MMRQGVLNVTPLDETVVVVVPTDTLAEVSQTLLEAGVTAASEVSHSVVTVVIAMGQI